ncbi:MAG: hypothetical protein M1837_007353 [Sclerophora amabilis]|nr:MAG: hypothetical protein M1837_007353 [Sclerophora amabilis]
MLRRQPTAITLTSEDVAIYEDTRAAARQHQQQQQQHMEYQSQHQLQQPDQHQDQQQRQQQRQHQQQAAEALDSATGSVPGRGNPNEESSASVTGGVGVGGSSRGAVTAGRTRDERIGVVAPGGARAAGAGSASGTGTARR